MTALLAPPTTTTASRWWLAGFVMAALALVASVAVEHLAHLRRIERTQTVALELQRTGQDLAAAVLHLQLAGPADSPWQRPQGLALLAQSRDALHRLAQAQPGLAGQLKALANSVDRMADSAAAGADQDLATRLAWYDMRRGLDELDTALRAQDAGEERDMARLFGATVGLCLLLLASLGLGMVRSERARGRAEAARRQALAELDAHRNTLELTVQQRTSDLQAALAALGEAERFAQATLDAQPTLLAYWDQARTLRYVNKAYLNWLGRRHDEVIGRSMDEVLDPAVVASLAPLISRAIGGEPVQTVMDLPLRNGRTGHFLTWRLPHRRGDGVDGYFFVATDITELTLARHRLEQLNHAQAEAERFARMVADSIPGRVVYWDRDLRCRFANRGFCNWYGLTMEQAQGLDGRTLPGIQSHGGERQARVEAVLAGQALVFEREDTAADGRRAIHQVHYLPDLRGGQVHGFFVVATDISAAKQAQRQLQELNDQLVRARDRAEAATRAKSAFLANMSHEIRTPMNAIIGLTHLLAQDSQDPLQRARLDKVDAAAQHLLQVIDEVLDLSKIEAGRMVLEELDFDTDALLSGTFDLVAGRARAKGLELVLDSDHLPARLRGDPTRLRQALLNLLSNAVKFTAQGWVRLRVQVLQRQGGRLQVRFEVADTGEGIAEPALARVFEAFEQADSSTTRRHGGTGLGLALTRHLAHLMGGEVGASSQPGQGSRFWFTAWLQVAGDDTTPSLGSAQGLRVLLVDDLPESLEPLASQLRLLGLRVDACASGPAALALAQAAHAEGRPHELAVVDWRMAPLDGLQTLQALHQLLGPATPPAVLVTAVDDPELGPRAQAAGFAALLAKPITTSALHDTLARLLGARTPRVAAAAPGGALARLAQAHAGQRVLLAEDNPVNLEVAQELLRRAGLVVDVASRGDQALALAAREPYALVLMDVQMPGMDGLQATRALRAAGHAVPVVAMTANAFGEDRAACLAAGMNDHVAKPVDPERLYDTLLRWLPAADPLMARLAAVPGLDAATALRQVGGQPAALRRVLRQFCTSYGPGLASLGLLHTPAGLAQARADCHSLRGAAATLGAATLLAEVRALEAALEAALAASGAPQPELAARVAHSLGALVQALEEALAEPADG